MDDVTFDDWKKLDLRVGKVLEVEEHPNADKLFILKVDIISSICLIFYSYKPETIKIFSFSFDATISSLLKMLLIINELK